MCPCKDGKENVLVMAYAFSQFHVAVVKFNHPTGENSGQGSGGEVVLHLG